MTQQTCAATTHQGQPCRSALVGESGYCRAHDPARQVEVQAARRRGGATAAKLRALEGRRSKLDTPAALVRFVGTLVQDVVSGTVEPDVARVALYGCSIQRQLLETSDLEARLSELEAAAEHPAQRPGKWR